MAITNPGLLVGFDTNGTNQGTPDNALITDGYTFQSIPKSADINRYLKELYRAVQFSKDTGIWQWDNSVSYSEHARIMRGQNIYRSRSDANQGNDPLSAPSFWQIDQWRMNTVTHNITVDSDYSLTTEQNNFGKVIITDTNPFLTGAVNIIVSDEEKDFILHNDTLQILTVKTSGGTGIAVQPQAKAWLLCDGTNVITSVTSLNGTITADNFIHFQDQKTSGTDGGTSSTGTQTRVLNTVLTNTIAGASLGANEITLPAGDYYIEAFAPATYCNGHQLTLRNVTDVSNILVGTSEHAQTGTTYSSTKSQVSGVFTLAAGKNVDLRHYTTLGRATDGLGLATGNDIEVYSDIKIWKVG